MLLGPFMAPDQQQISASAPSACGRVEVVTFDTHVEFLMERAVGVVAMAGYNTFCEILSLDKRAILVPRMKPRLEQLMRAARAASLGLAHMLDPEESHEPEIMTAALRNLLEQPLPSERERRADAERPVRHHRSRGGAGRPPGTRRAVAAQR